MSFSKRIGIHKPEPPISIRYDAPRELRLYLLLLMLRYNGLKMIRTCVCYVTKVAPDPNNWGENEFMKQEIETLLEECPWYYIYDIIEYFDQKLSWNERTAFEEEMNEYFVEKGIGWKLVDGEIKTRGEEAFEQKMAETIEVLNEAKLETSKQEIQEALNDLSRRPEPDITGSVQHALAALECLCREITGDSKDTLGKLINNNPDIVPKPLNEVIGMIWGFASGHGRHLQEGKAPDYEEAELVVHLCAILCTYLSKKSFKKEDSINDFPF